MGNGTKDYEVRVAVAYRDDYEDEGKESVMGSIV